MFRKEFHCCFSRKFNCYTTVYTYESDFVIDQEGGGVGGVGAAADGSTGADTGDNNNNNDDDTNDPFPFDNVFNHVQQLVDAIKEEFQPTTHIRMKISTQGLQGSIQIPYRQVEKLDSEIIFDTISKIMQSSNTIPTGKWTVEINHVDRNQIDQQDNKFPGGSRRRSLTEPVFDWLLSRQADNRRNRNVYEVPGDDTLCLIKVFEIIFFEIQSFTFFFV